MSRIGPRSSRIEDGGSEEYRIYNIGNDRPVELLRYIEVLEDRLGRTAKKNFMPLQLGDVPASRADVDDLARDFGYRPRTTIGEGVSRFVK